MTEESDNFIRDWPSVQLPKSRSSEYWQSSLGGFVFRVLLRPPEKCKFEFTRDITESRPPPPSKKIFIPMNPPFLWKYFQDLCMNQQTFSSLTEFQVRPRAMIMYMERPTVLWCYLVIMWCAFIIMMCSFHYVIFHTEKHFARRYSGWLANTIPANRWINILR